MAQTDGPAAWTEELHVLDLAVDHLVSVCVTIDDRQLGVTTPCADWDLQGLLDHVVGGNRFTSAILAGATAEEAMGLARLSFSSGSARVLEVAESAEEMRERFGDSGVRDRLHSHVVGNLTGLQVLRLRLHDLIVHAWDIAEAINPPASIPDALVSWGRNELAHPGSLTSDHFATDSSRGGPKPSIDAYLDSFGRRRPA